METEQKDKLLNKLILVQDLAMTEEKQRQILELIYQLHPAPEPKRTNWALVYCALVCLGIWCLMAWVAITRWL